MQRALLLTASSFFVGIAWRSVLFVDVFTILAFVLTAVAVVFVSGRQSFHVGVLVALMAFGLVLGVARTEFAFQKFEQGQALAEGSSVSESGTVVGEPDVRENHTNITILLDGPTRTTVLARVPHAPAFTYGDRVQAKGTLRRPDAFVTDTGRTFHYDGYLMKDGIHFELTNAYIDSEGGNEGNALLRTLFVIKNTWLASIARTVPEPSASLLGGIVVGAKRSLGDEWLTAFRDTGLIHIVVLSGYNLTIVALFIVWLTKRFSRKVRLALGLLSIAAFALMTGAGATVVRASIMAGLALIAQFLARPYAILRALVVAAVVMALSNPFLVVFDSGFQLSFIATLGLVTLSPLIERHLSRIPTLAGLRTIVAATLATQLAVLPLLLFHIGNVSLVAPLVNVLVLPIIPLAMAVGFGVGLIGIVSTTVAMPFALISHGILTYIFSVVAVFDSFSYAAILLPPIPWWLLLACYAGSAYAVYQVYAKQPPVPEPTAVDPVSKKSTERHQISLR